MTMQDSANTLVLDDKAPAHPAQTGGNPHLGDRAIKVASTARDHAIPPSMATGTALAFEYVTLVVAGVMLTALWLGPSAIIDIGIFGPLVGGPLLFGLAAQATGSYELDRLRRHQNRLGRMLGTWAVVFGVFAVTLVVGDLVPKVLRSWFLVWFLGGAVTLMVTGAIIETVVRDLTRAGRLQRRAVLVGGGPNAESLIKALEETGGNELKILGIFDDRDDQRSPESQQGYPKLGNTSDLVEFARLASIDLLIVSIPMTAETRLLQLLKQLWVLPVDIRLAAHANKLRLRPRSYSYIGSVPFLDLFDRPIAGWDSVVKRTFDLVFASLAVILLAPVMAAVAIAVKLDSPGPALFRQKRYGFNNEVIEVLKFRSMYTDKADHAARKVVTRDDPRVTPVGRFIRRTSLDELPQFFNVLKGDLSIVGPRPHAVNAHTKERLWEEVVDGYFARHKVKPGVTGWAQINGWRGEVDTPDKIQGRVEHDLYYIENWSVLFDLYIMALTPIRIINQENAY